MYIYRVLFLWWREICVKNVSWREMFIVYRDWVVRINICVNMEYEIVFEWCVCMCVCVKGGGGIRKNY